MPRERTRIGAIPLLVSVALVGITGVLAYRVWKRRRHGAASLA